MSFRTVPQTGEVWFVDLGFVGKPRYALVLAARTDARLALASVVLLTTRFEGTPYEVTLPRVPWLREQSYINVQSIQPVKFTEFVRKAPGKFDARVIGEVEAALKRWLKF
ncbi:MAG TPA: type II toxin-antitoxin system PemK/MazF family toxin [Verrucomicrobiae bacterium]|nr:type II toxin-antitoxin system PemK/MazF family toxin [Verrucomicrobiae bacterium]